MSEIRAISAAAIDDQGIAADLLKMGEQLRRYEPHVEGDVAEAFSGIRRTLRALAAEIDPGVRRQGW